MLQFEGNYPGWVHAAGGWRCTHTAERRQELLLFPASSNPFLQERKGRQRKQQRLKTENKTEVEAAAADLDKVGRPAPAALPLLSRCRNVTASVSCLVKRQSSKNLQTGSAKTPRGSLQLHTDDSAAAAGFNVRRGSFLFNRNRIYWTYWQPVTDFHSQEF